MQGATYWYYQYTDVSTSKVRQLFVGPDRDPKVRELERRSRERDRDQIARMAKAAIALGCSSATPVHFRIIRRLNEVGFFDAGGLLAGTHVFLAYGNGLGVSWGDLARTQDPDFARAGNHIELALPGTLKVQTGSVIESLEAGFLPTPGFRPWEKNARFVSKSDKTLKIDFLAPMIRGRDAVYEHEQLGVNLQAQRFMEFILEDIGADQMDRLEHLWRNIYTRDLGWRERARKGITALARIAPELPALEMMRATQAAAARGEFAQVKVGGKVDDVDVIDSAPARLKRRRS